MCAWPDPCSGTAPMKFVFAASLACVLLIGCAPGGDEASRSGEEGAQSDDAVTASRPLRFDVATLDCASSAADEVCPSGDDRCLCDGGIEALNYGDHPHFLAMGSDRLHQSVKAEGNALAVYVDDLNTDYGKISGAARADRMVEGARARFPSGLPKYFVINEISAGTWPDSAAYRDWVVAVARRLSRTHGRTPIIAAPFARPANHPDAWRALAAEAYVAAEVYLTGKEINASGNSASFCASAYQASKDAYTRLGIPASRLMLVEHYGSTASGTKWGRAGVGRDGWHNAIEARAEGARRADFAGYISYSWASNQMHDPESRRLGFIDTYAAQKLP